MKASSLVHLTVLILGFLFSTSVVAVPYGYLDSVTVGAQGIVTLKGWAYDPARPSVSIPVAVDAPGVYAATGIANEHRADVNAAMKITGNHGFTIYTMNPGSWRRGQTVAFHARAFPAAGNAVELQQSPRSIVAKSYMPIGYVDSVAFNRQGLLVVSGWAVDPDKSFESLEVWILVEGMYVHAVANLESNDVNRIYNVAGSHRFRVTIENPRRWQPRQILSVPVFAKNSQNKRTATIFPGALSVAVPDFVFPPYHKAWSDEFNGDSLDPKKWAVFRGHWAQSWRTPDTIRVANGQLTLATFTENGKNHCGGLTTGPFYQPTFGYVEARIRFRDTKGAWGAFWLQSPTYGKFIGDPKRSGVEMDIVEHGAENHRGEDISKIPAMTVHWDGYGRHHKQAGLALPLKTSTPLQGNWHTYGVLWTDVSVTFFIDEVARFQTAEAVSHRSEEIRFSCQIISTPFMDGFFGGPAPTGGFGSRRTTRTGMDVDWVRVWQK